MARSTKKTPSAGTKHRASGRRYRERMHSEGLRHVSLWLHDRSSPAFARECRRQSLLASRRHSGPGIDRLIDENVAEIDGWTA